MKDLLKSSIELLLFTVSLLFLLSHLQNLFLLHSLAFHKNVLDYPQHLLSEPELPNEPHNLCPYM